MPDVDSSPHFGQVCRQLPSEFFFTGATCDGIPASSWFSLSSSVSPALPPEAFRPDVKKNQGESHETPTLPWLPRLPFFFSFLSVISPSKSSFGNLPPQLSHFPGIWLRGRERLDRAGLVGAVQTPGPEKRSYSPLPPKCHLSCSRQTDAALGEDKGRPPSAQNGRGVNEIAHLSRYFHLTQHG